MFIYNFIKCFIEWREDIIYVCTWSLYDLIIINSSKFVIKWVSDQNAEITLLNLPSFDTKLWKVVLNISNEVATWNNLIRNINKNIVNKIG